MRRYKHLLLLINYQAHKIKIKAYILLLQAKYEQMAALLSKANVEKLVAKREKLNATYNR